MRQRAMSDEEASPGADHSPEINHATRGRSPRQLASAWYQPLLLAALFGATPLLVVAGRGAAGCDGPVASAHAATAEPMPASQGGAQPVARRDPQPVGSATVTTGLTTGPALSTTPARGIRELGNAAAENPIPKTMAQRERQRRRHERREATARAERARIGGFAPPGRQGGLDGAAAAAILASDTAGERAGAPAGISRRPAGRSQPVGGEGAQTDSMDRRDTRSPDPHETRDTFGTGAIKTREPRLVALSVVDSPAAGGLHETPAEVVVESPIRTDEKTIWSAMQRRVGALRARLLHRLKPWRSVAGRMDLVFLIDRQGRIPAARVHQNRTGDRILAAQIVNVVRGWRFPPPRRGAVRVHCPLIFLTRR